MNHSRSFFATMACVFALVLTSALHLNSQQLQKGIHVDLFTSANAKPAPAADTANAWIVSIGADGRLWFGTTPVTADGLTNKMIETPRNRDQNLYIKADARSPYFSLVQVLKAAHIVGFESPVLLTSQPISAQANGVTPPMGLDIWIENGAHTGARPVEIEIARAQESSVIRVNNEQVSWENLAGTIKDLSNQPDTIVRLRADGEARFGQVARAIDASTPTGAKVVLTIPSL
jgi:biopolymer transport protein ExbD